MVWITSSAFAETSDESRTKVRQRIRNSDLTYALRITVLLAVTCAASRDAVPPTLYRSPTAFLHIFITSILHYFPIRYMPIKYNGIYTNCLRSTPRKILLCHYPRHRSSQKPINQSYSSTLLTFICDWSISYDLRLEISL